MYYKLCTSGFHETPPASSRSTSVSGPPGAGGCPWDREQTVPPSTLPYERPTKSPRLGRGPDRPPRETGNVRFQVVSIAKRPSSASYYCRVLPTRSAKMTTLHPHVLRVHIADALTHEPVSESRAPRPCGVIPRSALDGLPKAPSLFRVQAKAARVGFDWPLAGALARCARLA